MTYLLSTEYRQENELAVSALDPALGLPLPPDLTPVLSERDREAPTLAEALAAGVLPDYERSLSLTRQGPPARSPLPLSADCRRSARGQTSLNSSPEPHLASPTATFSSSRRRSSARPRVA